jgi:hypothetical protein
MNPADAPMALAPTIMPSMTECGSDSRMLRSMNAPGSPSSPLQTRYFRPPFALSALRTRSHLMPVGKPAPPRPRSPDRAISATILSGVIVVKAWTTALYPSRAMYSSMLAGSIRL